MGLMDMVRAHARSHETGDRAAESTGTTNERSTNWYELDSSALTDSYQFVLRKGTMLPLPESQCKQERVREDKAVADDPPTDDSPSEIVPVIRGTNWYESAAAEAAVATLRFWYGRGMLDTLPACIPGFAGELARYSDRARLIGLVKAILDSVPGSLTAQERAVQFVTVLAPLIEGGTAWFGPVDESEN